MINFGRHWRIDDRLKLGLMAAFLVPILSACQEPGWAKDEELAKAKPPAGQLPPLPESYFPPPPEETSEQIAPIPAPVAAPVVPAAAPTPAPVVTITQVVPTLVPEPAPRNPEIRIPLPGRLYN